MSETTTEGLKSGGEEADVDRGTPVRRSTDQKFTTRPCHGRGGGRTIDGSMVAHRRVLWREIRWRICTIGGACQAASVHDMDEHVAWVHGGRDVSQPGSIEYAIDQALAHAPPPRIARVLRALLRWEHRQVRASLLLKGVEPDEIDTILAGNRSG